MGHLKDGPDHATGEVRLICRNRDVAGCRGRLQLLFAGGVAKVGACICVVTRNAPGIGAAALDLVLRVAVAGDEHHRAGLGISDAVEICLRPGGGYQQLGVLEEVDALHQAVGAALIDRLDLEVDRPGPGGERDKVRPFVKGLIADQLGAAGRRADAEDHRAAGHDDLDCVQLGLVACRDRHGLTGPGIGVFGRRQHKLVVGKADRGPGRALVRPPYGVGHVRRGDRAGGGRCHGELVRVRHRDGVEPAQRAAGREVAVDHIASCQAVAGAVDGHDGQCPGVGGAHTVEVAIRDRASVVDILDERVVAPDPHAGGRQLNKACRRGVEDERQEPARQIVVG